MNLLFLRREKYSNFIVVLWRKLNDFFILLCSHIFLSPRILVIWFFNGALKIYIPCPFVTMYPLMLSFNSFHQVFKDERLSELNVIPDFEAHEAILTEMYMNQILKKMNSSNLKIR